MEDMELVEDVLRSENKFDLSKTQTTDTTAAIVEYKTKLKTWLVIFVLGIGWGTCTLANVGPGTTSSFVAKSVSGTASSSWIPNAALFPLIGLQPLWVTSIYALADVRR